jgi:hypothetical protein
MEADNRADIQMMNHFKDSFFMKHPTGLRDKK